MSGHKRTCPAYGNYQPPYEECDCGADMSEQDLDYRDPEHKNCRNVEAQLDAQLRVERARVVELEAALQARSALAAEETSSNSEKITPHATAHLALTPKT